MHENPDGVVGVERSGEDSSEECYVRFVNTTQRSVRLVWLDGRGKRVPRVTLAAQTAHSLFTYRQGRHGCNSQCACLVVARCSHAKYLLN